VESKNRPRAHLHEIATPQRGRVGEGEPRDHRTLGHTQAATTKHYAFLFDDTKREAADLMSARLKQALKARPALRVVPGGT
jgi:hypothetical protein